jgi:hypothetical protein
VKYVRRICLKQDAWIFERAEFSVGLECRVVAAGLSPPGFDHCFCSVGILAEGIQGKGISGRGCMAGRLYEGTIVWGSDFFGVGGVILVV